MSRVSAMIAALAVVLSGCAADSGPAGPTDGDGIDFGLAGGPGSHRAQGSVSATGAPLDGEFAVAVPDSLGGLVLVSYDAATSDLFILQVASTAAGSYACGPVETDVPCHARLFENVRMADGLLLVDGRFDLVEGTLALQSVGPLEVVGTFQARLDRTYPEGQAGSIVIANGSIRVGFVDEQLAKGGLNCLIALAGGDAVCDAG